MHEKPVPQPALGAAAELEPGRSEITAAQDFDVSSMLFDRRRDPLEHKLLGRRNRRQPRRGGFGQDHGHIQSAGANQHGPSSAGSAGDGDLIGQTVFDDHVFGQPPRRPQHDGLTGQLPEPQDGPGAAKVGLMEECLVEGQILLNRRQRKVQQRQ